MGLVFPSAKNPFCLKLFVDQRLITADPLRQNELILAAKSELNATRVFNILGTAIEPGFWRLIARSARSSANL
jgi:hypothetical protein